MKLRLYVFLALCAVHALPLYLHITEPMAPLWTGSIYLPLMGLSAFGVPVFSSGASGGWQSPSFLGWGIVILFWVSMWFSVAGLAVKIATYQKRRVTKQNVR